MPAAVDPARRAAYDVLRAVTERGAYANLVLPGLLRERGISGRDAAFATELAYGTLRWQGTYDAVLAACVDRPLDRVDPTLRDALRLGTHQLLALRVATHAAVSVTVDLARAVAGEGAARFANAVLRRVAARPLSDWITELAPAYADDPVAHLALAHAHPRWVVAALRDALGGDLGETAAALAADNIPAAVTLAARPGRATRDDLVAAGASPARWSPYAAHLSGGGDPAALDVVRRGVAGVQDEGSQLVALALANTPVEGADRRWLDLCAGPGGKAALLAGIGGLVGQRDAALLAVELRPHRAALVARSLRGSAGRYAVVVADARVAAWQSGAFDRVLVDVPCSGLGALRRRPESRWQRGPADVAALGRLQRELLAAALDAVRPGGVVAYATCSPHLAETRVVVDDVLRKRPAVDRVDARPALDGVPDLGDGPDVQLWPHRHGTDAMYLALLRRR
ncbi:transcription antitermination factor NusB [soil metagenome]|jgi:16S rRNA (cytosine967-C5)-methyltransferase